MSYMARTSEGLPWYKTAYKTAPCSSDPAPWPIAIAAAGHFFPMSAGKMLSAPVYPHASANWTYGSRAKSSVPVIPWGRVRGDSEPVA